MSARLFSPVSSAKFGRLWPFHFREVAAWLLEVYFCALLVTYRTSDTLKVIEVFPDDSVLSPRRLVSDKNEPQYLTPVSHI